MERETGQYKRGKSNGMAEKCQDQGGKSVLKLKVHFTALGLVLETRLTRDKIQHYQFLLFTMCYPKYLKISALQRLCDGYNGEERLTQKGNWKRKKEIEVGGVKFDNGYFLFYHQY